MIRWAAFALLCAFYGAYLWKQLSQRRQGITTNVMIRGQKSGRAYRIGIMLVLTTYLTCAVQFLSCFWSGHMGPVLVPEALRICGLVLMIGVLKSRAEFVLNFLVRMILGAICIVFLNNFFDTQGIALAVGLNPVSLLTSGTLGFSGVALLYGILACRFL